MIRLTVVIIIFHADVAGSLGIHKAQLDHHGRCRKNITSLETQFCHLSPQRNLPVTLSNALLCTDHSSFIKSLNEEFHHSTLTKSCSTKRIILYRLRQFFSPFKMLALFMALIPRIYIVLFFLCVGVFHPYNFSVKG